MHNEFIIEWIDVSMKLNIKSIIAALVVASTVSTMATSVHALTTTGGTATDSRWESGLGNVTIGVQKSFGGTNTYGF
ncbi:MAG: hypothetical protein ACRC6F_01735 [Aeromonas sp.]